MNKPSKVLNYSRSIEVTDLSIAGILQAKESLRDLVLEDFDVVLPAKFNDENIELETNDTHWDTLEPCTLVVRFQYTNPNFEKELSVYRRKAYKENAEKAKEASKNKRIAAVVGFKKQYKESKRLQRIKSKEPKWCCYE